MRRERKCIAAFLVCAMLFSVLCMPVGLAAEETVLYENSFDAETPEAKPNGLSVTENAEKEALVRVAEVEDGNRVLSIHRKEGNTVGGSAGPRAAYKLDLTGRDSLRIRFRAKADGASPSVGLYSGDVQKMTKFLNVEESKWVEVSVEVDLEEMTYTATIGGRRERGDVHAISDLSTCQIRLVATVESPGAAAYYDDIRIAVTGAGKTASDTPAQTPANAPAFVPTSVPQAPSVPEGAYVFMQTEFNDASLGKATSSKEKGTKIFSGGTSYTEIVDAGDNRLMRYWAADGAAHNPRTQVPLNPQVKHFSADYAVIPSESIAHLTIYATGGQKNDLMSISAKTNGVKTDDWNYVHIDIDMEKKEIRGTVNGKKLAEESFAEIADLDNAVLRFDSRLKANDVIYWDAMAFYTTDEFIGQGPLKGGQQVDWSKVQPARAIDAGSFVSNLTPHPRLLAHDWAQMREKTKSGYLPQMWYRNLKKSADQALQTPPVTRVVNSRGNILESARSARDRLLALAFVYNIEGDRAYLDKAYAEMLAYGEWEDWSGFTSTLVTAEILSGYSYAYDWLHDDLTPEQRQKIIDIVKAKGLPDFIYCIEGQPSGTNFITTSINWNPVCNSSLIAWALATADELPLLSEYLLENAPPAIQNALPPYAPQGGYPEGVTYWSYGTGLVVIAGDFLENAFVEGFELPESYIYRKAPGLADTADFGIYYDGPAGRFNYGDCGTGRTSSMIMYWAANHFNKPHYAWWEDNRQLQLGSYMSGYSAVAALSWYDADNAYNVPGAFPLDKFYSSPNSVNGVSMRSSWNDSTALYTAMQGGNNAANHQHWSLGTYIIDYMGKRFVRVMDHYDYALSGSKQSIYYKRAESYNTLVINPSAQADQVSNSVATLVKSDSSAQTAYGILDMTATNTDFADAKRGIMLTDNRRRVIVQDEVSAKKPSEFYWFANTDANIKIAPDGKSALLTIGEDRMLARIIEAPAEARFAIMERKSLIEGVNNALSSTDVGKKLYIHLENKTALNLAVEYVALKPGEGIPAPGAYVPLAKWNAEDAPAATTALAGSNVVLKLNTPNAIANGQKTFVDTNNTEVVPFTENGRTLVPVRFISESFGAKVGWDEQTQTVSVTHLDKEIKLVIGSNEMKVNGKTVLLDTPANTYNARTLIPLRALVEALGKTVFWDDRGLIVISDAPVSYTEEELVRLIAELDIRVKVNGKDVAFFETDKTAYAIDLRAGEGVPVIEASTLGSQNLAVTQATQVGDTATVVIDAKTYTFKVQTDIFEKILGHKDAGVIAELNIRFGNRAIPEQATYIYVEDLTDSTDFATYPKRGIVDGIINEAIENRWAAQGECWIQMDFGSVKNVHSMAFAGVSQDSRAYNFEVLASEDGINYKTVHTGGAPATKDTMSILPLGDVQARFVKIVGKGNNTNAWNTYAEVRFYESAAQQNEDVYFWPAYFGSSMLRAKAGTTEVLTLNGKDAYNDIIAVRPDAEVTYKAADESIARIAADGTASFLKAGTTTVTVTVTQDGYTASTTVTITVE